MLVLDGPLGSYLIARGIASHRVWRAALDAPELVVAGHRAYLEAGARVVLTNTFALPTMMARDGLDDSSVSDCVDTALDLALRACEPDHSATIHINFGPPACEDKALAQSVMTRALRCAALRIKRGRAVSAWIETLDSKDVDFLPESLQVLDGAPYALSFMLTDEPPANLAQMCEHAWACGCNCSAFDPKDVLRMQKALHAWSAVHLPRSVKRLCKPALSGTGGIVLPQAERLGFDLIGACCGGTISDIALLSGVEVLQ